MTTRREFLRQSAAGLLGVGAVAQFGCRTNQTAQVVKPGDKQVVGSHAAGSEVYDTLINEAVTALLARHSQGIQPAAFTQGVSQTGPLRICFVGVENKTSEEIGDFRDQIFEQIDGQLQRSQVYQTVSRRYVQAGLTQCRLRPEELFIPQNMQTFSQVMQQMQQPFDFLLFCTLTSGTTRSNKDYQRSYLMTLEMINIHNGQDDKEQREIVKKYNVSAMAKVKSWF
ncbi:MAG: hypothetical protein ABSF26_18060 [Thermoguttaceae bacterium]|jgi:hypothetical protein